MAGTVVVYTVMVVDLEATPEDFMIQAVVEIGLRNTMNMMRVL